MVVVVVGVWVGGSRVLAPKQPCHYGPRRAAGPFTGLHASGAPSAWAALHTLPPRRLIVFNTKVHAVAGSGSSPQQSIAVPCLLQRMLCRHHTLQAQTAAQRQALGITDGLIRVAVGIEDTVGAGVCGLLAQGGSGD